MVVFQLVVATRPTRALERKFTRQSNHMFLVMERVNKDKQRASPPLTVCPFVKIRFPWPWVFLLEHGKNITPNLQTLNV